MPTMSSPRSRSLPWPSSRIERDVLYSLRQHAQRTGRLTADIVAKAVAQYLERQEGAPTLLSADECG